MEFNRNIKYEDKKRFNINDSLSKEQFFNLEYPYYYYFITLDEINKIINDLKYFKPNIKKNTKNKKLNSLIINDKYYKNIVIVENYKENSKYNKITDFFTQECRVLCKFLGKNNQYISEYQNYKENKNEIYKYLIENNKDINYHNLSEYIYSNFKKCTNFKITICLSLLKIFKPKKWIDISSGWGDRLISSIIYDCDYYGTDPSECLKNKYNNIIKLLKHNNNISIQNIGFEDNNYPDNYVDFIFSSPPFFELEIYENNIKQSNKKYNKFDIWVKDFLWNKVIKESYRILEKKGHLVLYINDYKKYKYTEKTIEFVKNNINGFNYCGQIYWHDINNIKLYRSAYVWQKVN
jgi:hypothetical protein